VLYGYAGQSDKLDRAIAELALLAADQVTGDWEILTGAISRGEIEAKELD
jgi:hypothetical protein